MDALMRSRCQLCVSVILAAAAAAAVELVASVGLMSDGLVVAELVSAGLVFGMILGLIPGLISAQPASVVTAAASV